MPQTGGETGGGTADGQYTGTETGLGGNTFTLPKKKKPPLALVTETAVGGNEFNNDAIAAEIKQMLKVRAAKLPEPFVADRPAASAFLLFSLISTPDLPRAAQAYDDAARFMERSTSTFGKPASLAPFYARVLQANDPDLRSRGLQFLEQLKALPLNEQAQIINMMNSGQLAAAVADHAAAAVGGGEPILGRLAEVGGAMFSAPFVGAGWLLSHTAQDVAALLEKVPVIGEPAADIINQTREDFGASAAFFGERAMYGLRAVEGVAAGVGAAAFGFPMGTEAESFAEQFGRYVPTWDEFKGGEHSGLTVLAFDLNGEDITDVRNQGKAAFFDLVFDTVTGEVAARSLASVKTARSTPYEVRPEGLVRSLTAQEFVATKAGQAVVNNVVRVLDEAGENAAGALQLRYTDMDPTLARQFAATDGTYGAVARVLEERIALVPTKARLAELEARRLELVKGVEEATSAGDAAVAAALSAEEIALRQQILDINRYYPVMQYPKTSRLRAALFDDPITPTEKVLHALFGPVRKIKPLDVRRWTDELSPGYIWNEAASNAPPNARLLNQDYFIKQMNVARVPAKMQREVLTAYGRVVTDVDLYEFTLGPFRDALEHGLTLGGKRPLTETMREALQFTTRSVEERTMAPVFVNATDEFGRSTVARRNVLETPEGSPLPAMPTETLGHMPRLDIERFHTASSTIRYWDDRLKGLTVGGQHVGRLWEVGHVPFDVARFVLLDVPRLYIKPSLLVLRQVAIIQKIAFDQALRNVMHGMKPFSAIDRLTSRFEVLPGGTPVAKGLRETLPITERGKPQYSIMGTVADELTPELNAIRYFESTKNLDVTLTPARADLIGRGTFSELSRLHGDPLARMVAQRGPEATWRHIQENPSGVLGYWYEHGGGKALVERSGSTPMEWLTLLERRIDQYAGGLPSLRQYVASGKWKPPGRAGFSEVSEYAVRRDVLIDETRQVSEAIKQARLDGDTVLENTLAARLDMLDGRLEELDSTYDPALALSAADEGEFVAELLNRYTAGEYTFPPEVPVTQFGTSAAQGWRAAATRHNQKLYRGLRPMAAADIALTRGSMYWQLYNRTYDALIKNGWEKDRAARVAQYHAGFTTADIMYDISARTSVQRTLKNWFWFAPVVQEQLVTWLIKVPNRSYWPLGFPIRAGEVTAIWRGFQDLGLIQTDENGDKRVTVPGLSTALEKLTGGSVEIPELLDFNPLNLNILGQGLPTLAPGAEAILNFATDSAPDELKPLLRRLSDFVTWEGPATAAPSALNNMWTLITNEAPPWEFLSQDQQEQMVKRAKVQALQFAMSDLAAEGITPPVPGDYETPEDFEYARGEFIAEMNEKAKEYENGLQLVRLLGSMIFPTSMTATSPAKEAWFKWKNEQGFTYPYTEDDYAAMDARLAEHPEEWPFAIGYYERERDEPALPGDAPYTDRLISAIKQAGINAKRSGLPEKVLDRGPYIVKLMALNGLRYEEARLNGELKAAGLGSVPQQLANRAAYNDIYVAHLNRLRVWFAANPAVDKYVSSLGDDSTLTFDQEVLLEGQRILKELESKGVFDGPGAITVKDYKVVQGILGEQASRFDFGPPGTNAAKQRDWYYETVTGPVFDKVDPLYDKARKLGEGNQDAAYLYEQIRKINDAANKDYFYPTYTESGQGVTYGTARFPTPEEYTFGAKNEKEQRLTILSWTTRPQTWLTRFQMDTIGYEDFKGRDRLLSTIRRLDNAYYKAKSKVSSNSHEADALYAQRVRDLHAAGEKYGEAGQELVRLYLAPPITRLLATGFAEGNRRFAEMAGAAAAIVERIEQRGYSPRGYSEYAVGQKAWLEGVIESLRDRNGDSYNPTFDRLWTQLELAIPAKGYERRRFVPLYEAVLFGQFDPNAFGMDELVKAVLGG